ncbi:2907_t:CDS:2 [Cetraspora pellucida]|uniref:2907_t:CDS:1 n=1 Tax=Cetraspora pellucida TaxID=1433469 RepID=A0A9N9NJL3_9GLOM|nr:2907_t:CDS:2 [Cetraspora pellucida]
MSGRSSDIAGYLTTVSRMHRVKGLADPTKGSAVQCPVNSVRKWVARDAEADWLRDLLLVEAIKFYLDCPPENNDETSRGTFNLKKKDLKWVDDILWLTRRLVFIVLVTVLRIESFCFRKRGKRHDDALLVPVCCFMKSH